MLTSHTAIQVSKAIIAVANGSFGVGRFGRFVKSIRWNQTTAFMDFFILK